MKQALTAIKSLVLRSPLHHIVSPRKVFAKYSLVLLLAGFAVISSSFQKENRISGSQKEKTVPFKGKFTVDLTTGVVGTGVGTHIGKFTIVVQDNLQFFPNITGTVTITAANGDQIFATHTGLFHDLGLGMAEVDFDNTIIGGTGRFAGATGSYESHADVNLVAGAGSATFDGTISY